MRVVQNTREKADRQTDTRSPTDGHGIDRQTFVDRVRAARPSSPLPTSLEVLRLCSGAAALLFDSQALVLVLSGREIQRVLHARAQSAAAPRRPAVPRSLSEKKKPLRIRLFLCYARGPIHIIFSFAVCRGSPKKTQTRERKLHYVVPGHLGSRICVAPPPHAR